MILVNVDYISGREFDVISLVKGSTARAKHIGKDFLAGFRNIAGGEVDEYTEMLSEAREIAISRMIADAERLGGDAIVNVRFASSDIANGVAEVIAYGTAVKLK